MKKLLSVLGVAVVMAACSKSEAPSANLETTPAAATGNAERSAPSGAVAERTAPPAKPEYREVTVPSGTVLPIELTTAVASDTSHVEDEVRGTVGRDVRIDGLDVIPAGSSVLGHVTAAERPGKVKGRASVGFRFNALDLPGPGERLSISTKTVSRLAPATKKQDAAKIGGGAAGGAIIGGILGGGDGAAKGAAIGGGAGTAVVLSTRGKDVRVPPGTQLSVTLTAPLTVRVPMK